MFVIMLMTAVWLSCVSHGKMDFVIVKTPLGLLEGYRRVEAYDIPGKVTDAVDSFLGVPYAKPPTGARRFMDPEPVEPWEDTHQATRYPPMCVQPNVNSWFTDVVGVPRFRMNEDCLYLNIYAPYQSDEEAAHPVMVYLHGGSNKIGSANYFDGHVMAMLGVVVVIPNFRLGPLGFLSTGDDVIPGNAGFMDQVLVLKWIRDNIRAFGGDANRVTIFGSSAGGWDVSVHLVSPFSKGLFHGAIIQSGSGLSELAQTSREDIVKLFWRLADRLQCVTETKQMTVRCLQQVRAEALFTETLDHYSVYDDGRVLTGSLENLVKKGIHPNVSVIIGVTAAEWARFFLHEPVQYLKNHGSVANVLKKTSVNLPHKCLDLVAFLYTSWHDVNNASVQGKLLLQVNGDRYIVAPSVRLAQLLSQSNSTFFYLFDHSIPVNLPPLRKYQWLSDYSYHESELPFVFGAPFSETRMASVWHDGRYSDVDRNISYTMMRMWTNFAKSRNPNSSPSMKWTNFRPETSDYLHISRHELKMGKHLRSQQTSFWNEIFPKLCRKGHETRPIPIASTPYTPTTIIPIQELECPPSSYSEVLWTVVGVATSCILVILIVLLFKCKLLRKHFSKSQACGS